MIHEHGPEREVKAISSDYEVHNLKWVRGWVKFKQYDNIYVGSKIRCQYCS